MTEEHDLQYLPDGTGSLRSVSETLSELIARGQADLSVLLARRQEPIYLARVRVDDKWGLITRDGSYVVEPTYATLQPFREGRCAFREYDGEPRLDGAHWWGCDRWTGDKRGGCIEDPYEGDWGFLDATGNPIAAARFRLVSQFSEGLAGVYLNERWGFIDRAGDIVIKPRFDFVDDFREGLCAVRQDILGFYRYIDRSGSYAFRLRVAEGDYFRCGIARVEFFRKYRGYINVTGKFIFKRTEYGGDLQISPGLGEFIDGVAYVRGRRRVFHRDCRHFRGPCDAMFGRNPCRCDASRQLCAECSFCLCENCAHGDGIFLNKNGDSILGSQTHLLDPLGDFSDGLGLVGLRRSPDRDFPDLHSYDSYGFVDTSGQIAIRPQFVDAHPFKNGYAKVKATDVGWTWIDSGGNVIGNREFEEGVEADDFVGGFAKFSRNGLDGFVDASGKVAIEPKFKLASDFVNGMAIVELPGTSKSGYIDKTGEVVIPCQFDEAMDFELVEP